jgi:hypothetical protein
MRALGVLICALALVGCGRRALPTGRPAPDPPSGELRPEATIPYLAVVEHLHFSTKSHMQLFRLNGRVVQIHGPVWKVDQHGSGATLRLGNAHHSLVRGIFADADDLKDVREGQEVDVVGTFEFRGADVTLTDASLKK